MQRHKNKRGHNEYFLEGRHLKLKDFREEARSLENQYLFKKNIPAYPRPEFHVSHLKHDTHQAGLKGIKRVSGFKSAGTDSLLWWSLAVGPDDVTSAETRLLETTFPDRTQDQAQRQQSFLGKFATSPAFMETSRLGSFRFTFPLEEVLQAYRDQFCSGAQPVVRVFKTVLYKQEVMYAVLVHSPANQEQFSKFPLLTDHPNAVCVYKDGRFIWRPEAMCETHSYELIQRPDKNQMEVRQLPGPHQFYVWDHVAVALHMERGQVLKFDADRLRENLKFCHAGKPQITRHRFENFHQAEHLVKELWPNFPTSLKKEMSLQHLLECNTQNRFSLRPQEHRFLPDDKKNLSSSHSGVRTESNSESRMQQRMTGPQTLIVGDFAIKGVKGRKMKKTQTYCFPKAVVSDMKEKIPQLLAEHPTVTNIIVHIGANDIMKRESEALKRDFTELLSALSSLDAQVFISGPVPPVRRGIERFSRLLALSTWLSTACTQHEVQFIDNFNSFWKRRNLFRADGICLNKSGVKLLISNLLYFLQHSNVPAAKA